MHINSSSMARLIAAASITALLVSPQSILAGQLSPGAADAGLPRSLHGVVPDQRVVNAPAMIRIEGMDLLAAPGALAPSAARQAVAQSDRSSGSASIRRPLNSASVSGMAESRCPTLAAIGGASRGSQVLGAAKATC